MKNHVCCQFLHWRAKNGKGCPCPSRASKIEGYPKTLLSHAGYPWKGLRAQVSGSWSAVFLITYRTRHSIGTGVMKVWKLVRASWAWYHFLWFFFFPFLWPYYILHLIVLTLVDLPFICNSRGAQITFYTNVTMHSNTGWGHLWTSLKAVSIDTHPYYLRPMTPLLRTRYFADGVLRAYIHNRQ